MTDKDEKTGWEKALAYMQHLKFGPPTEEMEVAQIMSTFFEFLTIQMLAAHMSAMPPSERSAFISKIRKGWTANLHKHVNEQVKKHQEVLDNIPDGNHLAMFIGDGENMRMLATKQLRAASKKVDELLEKLVEKMEEIEGE